MLGIWLDQTSLEVLLAMSKDLRASSMSIDLKEKVILTFFLGTFW